MSYPFEGRAQKWEDYRNLRTNQLDENFWTKVTKEVRDNPGSIDTTNKAINFPTHLLESSDSLWKKYSDAAISKGLKPNYTQFLENYKLVKDYDNNKIAKLINSAATLGVKTRDIKKSLKGNKDAITKLQKIMLNANPETQDLLAPYLTKDKTLKDYWKNVGEDIMEMPGEHPLATTILGAGALGGGAYGAYRGAKGAYNYMRPGSATPKPTTTKGPAVTNVQGTKVLNTKLNDHYRALHKAYEVREKGKGRKPKKFSEWKKNQNLGQLKKSLTSSQIKDMAKGIGKSKVTPSLTTKAMNMAKSLGKKVNPIALAKKHPYMTALMAAQYLMSDSDKE